MNECKLDDSAAESTRPFKEKATVTEVCAQQLSADTVAAGVTLAEETNEEDEPWHDPDTRHTWVRSDLSKNVMCDMVRISRSTKFRAP